MFCRQYALNVLAAISVLLGACPRKTSVARSSARPTRAEVDIYTESSSVNAVTPLGGQLWVGTGQGLVVWDLRKLTAKVLTVDDGLPGDDIRTLASDGKTTLWVGTATGVARLRKGRWTQFGDCPLGDNITSMATTRDGETVWVGGPKGLARLQHERWKVLFGRSGVTGLEYVPRKGALWVSTRRHGVLRCLGVRCEQFAADSLGGLHVKGLAMTNHGVLALLKGADDDRLAYRYKGRWHRYRLKPSLPLAWASFAKGQIFLASGHRVFRLLPRKTTETPPGPIELAPQTSGAPEFIAQRVKRQLPRRVTVVRQALGSLWIGSQRLGVARFNGDLLQYFRTNDLAEGARRLSLACTSKTRCYFATGSRLFLRSRGSISRIRYEGDSDAVFQWVGTDSAGGLLAVLRSGTGALEIARRARGASKLLPLELKPAIFTKRGPLRATFVRAGPGSKLWIGLAIEEPDGVRGAGVAVVDLHTGVVSIHGRGAGLPVTPGALGITSELTGAAFVGGKTYLGSHSGVIRIDKDHSVRVFTENDGLRSELIQDITSGPDGSVYVATSAGLGIFDGKVWRFSSDEGAQGGMVSSVLCTTGGEVFFGSPAGLHRLRHGRLTSYDESDGLLQSGVVSLARDPGGRLWLMHKTGLSIVLPVR